MNKIYDIFVVGGGINGCGIARDAASRGYSVILAEKNDLSSGTSSASSKLIHGGLRYLENYEFALVRKALKERDVLIKIAPHIVRESRFLMPYNKGLRPIWMLRLGMWLYDNLYFSKYLKRSSFIRFASHPSKSTLLDSFTKGFEYSDCKADDSRLTILNAIDAKDLGAVVKTRTTVKSIKQVDSVWEIETIDSITDHQEAFKAKIIVNATGPWVDKFLQNGYKEPNVNNIRLVKGSHIVVKKMFEHDYSYVFQNEDGRVFFAIPWENEFTFIGTTDIDFNEDLDNFSASEKEISYICNSANNYFTNKISENDVISHWSGVRPIFDDSDKAAQKASRDYVIKKVDQDNDSVLINIFGGKLTTFRQLSEDVVDLIGPILGNTKSSSTSKAYLPGGNFLLSERKKLMSDLSKKYKFLSYDYLNNLFNLYGTRIDQVLKGVSKLDDLGINFGKNLYQSEVDYLMKEEFALFPEDITERRTKLYLFLDKKNLKDLDKYMAKNR